MRTVEGGETVLFACSRVSSAEDPGILGFVNELLTMPRYNEHFGCFFENSLNRGVRHNENEQISPVLLYQYYAE